MPSFQTKKGRGWATADRSPQLAEDEIGISRPQLDKVFYKVSTKSLLKEFGRLGSPKNSKSESKIITIGSERIEFFRRCNGTRYLWAINADDLSTLATALKLKVRTLTDIDRVRANEVVCSEPNFNVHYIGSGAALAKKVKARLGDPQLAEGRD